MKISLVDLRSLRVTSNDMQGHFYNLENAVFEFETFVAPVNNRYDMTNSEYRRKRISCAKRILRMMDKVGTALDYERFGGLRAKLLDIVNGA